ncbi:TIGR04283 family arsenosugar biosynthesis glycosyltransferase [Microbulbifer sp. SAOS-129_SWC]|uniref:TIGR04283 family arsenosugar biosynthesis glycosyltransferase n=1 Tax=Microbulbifer sp. SAOS-129_SWC TaxID=3145235 RepID=UPI0032173D2A
MRLSIVIPLLNERTQLPRLLEHLQPLRKRPDCEIILVDGGSEDGSAELAAAAGFRVLSAPRGRGIQMNAGAAAAVGETLLFLHADTRLPDAAPQRVASALAQGADWGRFDLQIGGDSFWFPLISALINWRSCLTGIATGDQAIFVRRTLFEQLGGFPPQPVMEDIEFSKRLRRHQRPACVRDRVVTSGRRWQRYGVARTVLLMWRLRFAYWRGVPAEVLARHYE